VRVEAVVLRAPAIPSNYYKMPFEDGRAEEIRKKTETLSAPVYCSHRDSSPEREPWISPGPAAAVRRSPVAGAACPLLPASRLRLSAAPCVQAQQRPSPTTSSSLRHDRSMTTLLPGAAPRQGARVANLRAVGQGALRWKARLQPVALGSCSVILFVVYHLDYSLTIMYVNCISQSRHNNFF
jgi:hypothetical protein